jgi:hypothetical protein
MNFKSEEVAVVINIVLSGKMSNYSVQPKKDIVKVNQHVANEQHEIRWAVNIKPKETLQLRYNRLFNKRV